MRDRRLLAVPVLAALWLAGAIPRGAPPDSIAAPTLAAGRVEPRPLVLLGALDAEAQPARAALADPRPVELRGIPCVAGTLAGQPVVVAVTGVGKVNAAMSTALVVERFAPSAVVFAGVAGGLDAELQPGDVVVGERLVQHDLLTYGEEGSRLRGVRGPDGAVGPIELEADPVLLAVARRLAGSVSLQRLAGSERPPRVAFGIIATGDAFVGARAKRTELRAELGASAVEMEGAAVAQVCRLRGVPCLVVRGLSDRAAGQARDEMRLNMETAAGNAATTALAVARAFAAGSARR